MRQIEFRGKRIDNGEWVYGTIWSDYIIIEQYANGAICMPTFIKVNPSTVGQFTGLTDKNRKKIFEGDCLIYIGTNMSGMEVKFIDGAFIGEGPFNTLPLIDYINSYDFQSIEIIGNIHDNQELLNQQQ